MGETFSCEKWVDGSWWEATLPDGWHWRRDKNIKGWPYVCTLQEAKLIIHQAFSGAELHGYDWSIVPASVQQPLEREMYMGAAMDFRLHFQLSTALRYLPKKFKKAFFAISLMNCLAIATNTKSKVSVHGEGASLAGAGHFVPSYFVMNLNSTIAFKQV